MSNLYLLSGKYLELMDLAESLEEEDEQAFNDTLEAILGEVEIAADQYADIMAEINGRVDVIEKEIKRLTDRKRAFQNRYDRMKTAIFETMKRTEQKEIKTALHTFKIVKNGGLAPLVITGDVPRDYQVTKYEDDKAKIREALENGEELSFAHIGERGESLRIR